MDQITLFKFSYDLSMMDEWGSITNKLYLDIYNRTYSLIEQPNISIEWSNLTPQIYLDAIRSEDYKFSDSPHQIWPRPYLINNSFTWSVPQGQLIISNSGISYNVNNTSTNTSVQISEQCQGVPINQTFVTINGPENTTNFLSFQSLGSLYIDLSKVEQVGIYEVTIQNQEKLLYTLTNDINQFIYFIDDPLVFKIEFINEFPVIQPFQKFEPAYVNQKYSFYILFTDFENDQVNISFKSQTATIDVAEFVNNNK